MKKEGSTYDLQERLIEFSVTTLKFLDSLPDNRAVRHLYGQLMRSATATALIYGEAQGAESRKDFIHKMRLILKELRESQVCLEILKRMNFEKNGNKTLVLLNEVGQLVAIFTKSVQTASTSR